MNKLLEKLKIRMQPDNKSVSPQQSNIVPAAKQDFLGANKYIYTITQAAKFLGVSADTLRNWEAKGKLIPKRTKGGSRRYYLQQLNGFLKAKNPYYSSSVIPTPPPVILNGAQRSEGSQDDNEGFSIPKLTRIFIPKNYITLPWLGIKPLGRGLMIVSGVAVASTAIMIAFLTPGQLLLDQKMKNNSLMSKPAVLGESTETASISGTLRINIPTIFTSSVNISNDDGITTSKLTASELTAPNVIYSLSSGDGINVSSGQTPTIKNTGVLSLQSKTGALTLTEGTDITIDGLKITDKSTLDSVRGRGGCSSCILDADVASGLTISGGTVNDSPIGASTASTGAFTTLTASSTLAVTGATTLSSTLAVTGATTLSSTLAVTGETTLNGNITFTGGAASSIVPATDSIYDLGSATKQWGTVYASNLNVSGVNSAGQLISTYVPTSNTVSTGPLYINPTTATAGYTLAGFAVGGSAKLLVTSNGSLISGSDGSADLGSSDVRWNNLYVNSLTASGTNYSGQATFTYEPTSSAIGQGSIWINPTTATAAYPLLSVSVGGTEKARITSDGYLGLGGANDPGSTYFINAGSTFNVSTAGNVGIGITSPIGSLHIAVAPTATANNGLINLGSGPFDGVTSGKFAGTSLGTYLAINTASGDRRAFADFQENGVSRIKLHYPVEGYPGITFNSTPYATTFIQNSSGAISFRRSDGNTVFVIQSQPYFAAVSINEVALRILRDNDTTPTANTLELRNRANNANLAFFNARGNLGIGTSAAGAALQVNGGGVFGFGTISTAAPTNGLIVQGNVGIGATNPQAKLAITGNVGIGISFGYASSIPVNGLAVEGNVGIGTTSTSHNLEVVGTGNFSSTLSLANGSAATPTLNFSNSTGVGLWSPASNILALTSGTPASGNTISGLSINANGNVGIGTSNPVAALDVRGNIMMTNGNYFQDNQSGTIRNIFNIQPGTQTASFQGNVQILNNGSDCNYSNSVLWRQGGSHNFMICGKDTSSLGLQITDSGTANISSEYPLWETHGLTRTLTSSFTNQRSTLYDGPTLTAASALTVTNASTLAINGPPIAAASALITNAYGLKIESGTSVGSNVTNAYGLYVDAPTGAANNYAAVFSGGNVGIGTTSPSQLFQINNSTSNPLVFTSGGNLGIGFTSPIAPLHIANNGAASAPAQLLSGTWFTGGSATTTKPQLLIEPSGTTSTAWSTSGTGLGVNAASGFGGNLFDFQSAGVSRIKYQTNVDLFYVNNISPISASVISLKGANTWSIGSIGTTSSGTGGFAFLTPNVTTSPAAYRFTVGTYSAVTSEAIDISVPSHTNTITGSYATQRFNLFGQPTITAGSALSISSEASTINIAGAPISAGSATIANSIALKIASVTSLGSGVTNAYGLYVDAPTGATNNYAAVFSGGNVGIGITNPQGTLVVMGNVGIGVSAPSYHLDVAGGARFGCSDTTWDTGPTTSCSDVAEVYQSDGSVDVGEIVAVGQNDTVTKSGKPYQQNIIGVYSTSPGILIGGQAILGSNGNLGNGKIPVALSGRVPLKVSTESGTIKAGDYLTSSSVPGVAMKATRPGQVIGKALEDYNETGKIMAFVSVGFADPSDLLTNIYSILYPAQNKVISSLISSSTGGVNLPSDTSSNPVSLLTMLLSQESRVKSQEERIMNYELRIKALEEKIATASASLAEATQSASQSSAISYQLSDTQASSSASLTTDDSVLMTKLNLTPPDVLLATGSAVVADLKVLSSATISGQLTAYKLTVSDSFKSFGTSSLGNTTIAGNLSVDGTLSIENGSELNVIGTLYLQKSILAQKLDIFNGKVTIDPTGTLKAQTISAREFQAVKGASVGNDTLRFGKDTLVISSPIIKPTSHIFITSTVKTHLVLSVVDVSDGQFTVISSETPASDITFNWWVVNETN